jgi:hypothetical protein
VGQKRKIPDIMGITLLYLQDAFITMDEMIGKVPNLRYADHKVRDMEKFPDLVEETYLTNTGEIGPLGRPILKNA